jgi:NodT family efflux transporter outer membrane factor (OMF) lipoprotein|tara:strand:- start:1464 stop:2870 length:1407 start_codon:yes stop_codon:yes gene_type:complete
MILNYLDKIKRKNIYSIILIILISGCSSTKDRFERDLPSLPSDWSTSYESLKNISGWAETFNDKELVDIINEAIENNRNLRAASNRLEIARASSRASIAPLLPSVSVGLSKNQISRTIESKDDIKRLYSYKDSLGVQLNWEADIWGRLSRQSRSSFIEAEAAEADYEFVKLSIAGLTAQSWYLFSEAKLQNDLAKRNLETRLSTLKRVENRYKKGIAQSRDLRLARSELESTRADLINRQQLLFETARTLEVIIGRYPNASILPGGLPNLPPNPEIGTPSERLPLRPDIRALEAQLESAGLQLTSARLAFLPQLSLSAQWSTLDDNWSDALEPKKLAGTIIASLTQSIFQGGRRISNSQIKKAQLERILENYSQALLEAAQEAENAIAAEETLTKREEAINKAFNESKAAEELTLEQYNRGLSTIFELLDSQSRRLNAESLLINAKRLRLTNRIKMYMAIATPVFGNE